jgi:hypothetical protein
MLEIDVALKGVLYGTIFLSTLLVIGKYDYLRKSKSVKH